MTSSPQKEEKDHQEHEDQDDQGELIEQQEDEDVEEDDEELVEDEEDHPEDNDEQEENQPTNGDEKAENDQKEELLERMTSNEFREFLPHLELEDVFSSEIWKSGKWFYLISPSKKPDKSYGAYCHVCSERLINEKVIQHLKSKNHMKGLAKISHFYHPAFTYSRSAKNLMDGEKVSEEQLKEIIEMANRTLTKPLKDVAVNFAKSIKELINDKSYNKILEKLVLNHPIDDPRHMYAEVSLPLLTLLNLEYSVKEGEWKSMLTSVRPHPSSRFQCKLCDMSFAGLKKLVYHLSHPSHKKKQLECLGIRCKIYKFLNKNCIYRYGTKYSLLINSNAGEHYKEQILSELKKTGDSEGKEFEENTFKIPELSESLREKSEALRHQRDRMLETLNEMKGKKEEKFAIRFDGLIGVEYVIRILKSFKNTLNQYVCTLCDTVLTEARMAEHLIGYSHRLKYFETHYPATVTRYKNKMGHMKFSNFLRAFGLVLAKIAAALEDRHGYGTVRDVPVSMYRKTREEIIKDIKKGPHASQDRGPSFLNIVSNNELKEYIENNDLFVDYNLKHENPERFCLRSNKNYKEANMPDRKSRNARSRSKDRSERRAGRGRSRSRSVHRRRSRGRSGSPRRSGKRNHSLSPGRRDQNVWNLYRREVSKLASQIELKYVDYRQHPESHPLYKTEWNYFWKNRKEELMHQRIDHRSYNFQPEWVNFFKQRLELFFGEDLQNAQLEVRHRLNIPLDAEEDSPIDSRGFDPHSKRIRMEPAQNWSGPGIEQIEPLQPIPADNKPNVIHVLRLLTAFEDHLGSLGAKIMDLLAKALTLEKNLGDNPLELEACFFNATTCTILETAAEKLKGILFAGLLDPKKVKSFTSVIQSTADLLKHAEKMGYRNVVVEEAPVNISGTSDADLHTILNAIQKGGVNVPNQKALSVTLMDLIAGSPNISGHINKHGRKDELMENKNMPQRGGGGGGSGGDGPNDGGRGSGNQYNSSYRNSNNYNMNSRGSDRFNQQMGGGGGSNYNQMQQTDKQQMGSGLLSFDTNLRNPNTGGNMGGRNMDGGNMGGRNMDSGNMGSRNIDGGNMGGRNMDGGNMETGNMSGRNLGGNRSMGGGHGNYNDSGNYQRDGGPGKQGMGRNNYSQNSYNNSGGNMNQSNRANTGGGGGGGYRNNTSQNVSNFGENDMDFLNNSGGYNNGGSGGGGNPVSNNSGSNSGEIWRQYSSNNQQQRWMSSQQQGYRAAGSGGN